MNKFIKKQLNIYADASLREEKILKGAYEELEFKRQGGYFTTPASLVNPSASPTPTAPPRPAYTPPAHPAPVRRKRRRRLSGLAAAAAVVLFVVFAAVIGSNIAKLLDSKTPGGTNSPVSYSFDSLKRVAATKSDLSGITGVKTLTLSAAELTECYLFEGEDGEIYAAALKYRAVRQGNVDEIIIVSDIKGGLTDYKDKISPSGSTTKIYDVYENGEYYSYLCFSDKGYIYYAVIMSPNMYAASTYENGIL